MLNRFDQSCTPSYLSRTSVLQAQMHHAEEGPLGRLGFLLQLILGVPDLGQASIAGQIEPKVNIRSLKGEWEQKVFSTTITNMALCMVPGVGRASKLERGTDWTQLMQREYNLLLPRTNQYKEIRKS